MKTTYKKIIKRSRYPLLVISAVFLCYYKWKQGTPYQAPYLSPDKKYYIQKYSTITPLNFMLAITCCITPSLPLSGREGRVEGMTLQVYLSTAGLSACITPPRYACWSSDAQALYRDPGHSGSAISLLSLAQGGWNLW